MDIQNRHIVVTGGGSGIGRAMIERFAQDNPRGLVVVDRDAAKARAVAASEPPSCLQAMHGLWASVGGAGA